jgi:hypothetical protein
MIKSGIVQQKRMELYSELLVDEKHMRFGTYKDRLREVAKAEEEVKAKEKAQKKEQKKNPDQSVEKKAFNIKGEQIK